MLCSTLVTFCALNITFYQRTLLGASANHKRHYLKSYNNIVYRIKKRIPHTFTLGIQSFRHLLWNLSLQRKNNVQLVSNPSHLIPNKTARNIRTFCFLKKYSYVAFLFQYNIEVIPFQNDPHRW